MAGLSSWQRHGAARTLSLFGRALARAWSGGQACVYVGLYAALGLQCKALCGSVVGRQQDFLIASEPAAVEAGRRFRSRVAAAPSAASIPSGDGYGERGGAADWPVLGKGATEREVQVGAHACTCSRQGMYPRTSMKVAEASARWPGPEHAHVAMLACLTVFRSFLTIF